MRMQSLRGTFALFAAAAMSAFVACEKVQPPPAAATPGLLAVGSPAPQWELADPAGKMHRLSEKKGKVVMLDFWATWCGPCIAAMPSVQKLHDKFKDKGVEVIGVNCWEQGDAAAFMKQKNFTYPLVLKGDDVAKAYGVKGIPTFYIIGTDGNILHAGSGFAPGVEAEIESKIQAALLK